VVIGRDGAIRVGNIVVDGHVDGVIARVTTHIHSDHIRMIRTSFRRLALHIATPITHGLLEAYGVLVPRSKRLDVSYGAKILVEDVYVKLLRANHVPGSAEVLVEGADGSTVLYTGDFKMPGTEQVREVDVLVLDATYGMPEWVRPWQEEMDYLLPELVQDALVKAPVHIYAYSGKLEEVAVLLRKANIAAPIIVDKARYRGLSVLEKHGIRVDDVLLKGSQEALEARRQGWYVELHSFSEWRRRLNSSLGGHRPVRMLLTGWEFKSPYRWLSNRDLIVSFSDHADFTQLIDYVTETAPRRVIVDASRGGAAAKVFALYVSRKMNIPATAHPP